MIIFTKLFVCLIHLQVMNNDYIKKTLDKMKRKHYIDVIVMSMSRHGGKGPGY